MLKIETIELNWIKKILNVNIIIFENVDKPEGEGSDNVDKVIFFFNFYIF